MKRKVFKIAETGLMGVALWWGVLLSLPSKTFDNHVYNTMDSLLPESAWATVCLTIATILAVGMTTSKRIFRNVGY